MFSQLIQRQVPIGSKAAFSLKSGREISGILVELGRDHITLECDGGFTTVLIEMIGAWQVIEEPPAPVEEISLVLDRRTISDPLSTDLTPPAHLVPPPPSEFSEPEVMKKLFEIEARFQAQLQVAVIEIKPPNFSFPTDELKDKHYERASVVWNRIKDKYFYAVKIKELGAKFGRIQPLISELKVLVKQFPNSIAMERHLAYFYWLLGNLREAINSYKNAALISKEVWDWYNVAALGLIDGQEELACYSLEQFFNRVPLTETPEAWYLYVRLLKKYSNYRALNTLSERRRFEFSNEETVVLLETNIYLLIATAHEQLAMELVRKWLAGQYPVGLVLEALNHLDGQSTEIYQKIVSELSIEESRKFSCKDIQHQPQGYINTYKSNRGFGFIRGVDGGDYFFHRSAISDDELLTKIDNLALGKRIPVVFETAQGLKGPLAIGIIMYRTIEEMFTHATECANEGEYPKAIAQIKKVLELNPNYPGAQKCYEKWREYARMEGVPRGSNPYARAKRVHLIEKDLDKAAQLLRVAINQEDSVESAIKDLSSLLVQQGKPEEAIQVLIKNRKRIQDQQSVDNMLISFYQNASQYDQAIALLQKKFEQASTGGKKAQILWQVASCYLRKEDYLQAEDSFRSMLQLQPDNRMAQRYIAICLYKQGRYEDAQKILSQILNTSPDAKVAELLEAIIQAKTGQLPQIEEIIIETTLSDFPTEISKFAQFFLERCDFQGVPPDRVQRRNFNRVDIQKLEELATKLGTQRPRDRAGYYLSAAKITLLLEDQEPNQLYKYLCRSFASQGDAIVIEGRPLEAARAFYCESLSAYDVNRSRSSRSGDEQDAVNALVRFLFSTLGHAQIPIKPSIPSIDETLETVLIHHPDRTKLFDAIAYLVFYSRYAANRILNRLYDKSSLQAIALECLKSKGVLSTIPIKKLDDFVRLWNDLNKKISDETRFLSNEFRFLAKIELTTASIESSIERFKSFLNRPLFDLDQQRILQFQKILETALELCKEIRFEEQERLCIQIDNRCQDLLREIETSPTKISVEGIYPIIEEIRKKVNIKKEDLYESSIPQLALWLPVESYTPDSNQQIEVQVVVSNRIGCSPAEALELVVQEYEDTFTVKLDGSLRGGDKPILRIPIQVGEEALCSQAFSLPVYARYRTRSGEMTQTPINNFSIRLGSEEEFEEIENPYADYAGGGIVGNPEMFYGREELIANVAKTIQESRAQSKCVVIYGQKRAGKSSILHHLEIKLRSDKDLLVLNLGNIGSILDEHSSCPFLYQILWGILSKLKNAIEDRIIDGYSPLNMSFPADKEFYEHYSPLMLFKDIFERFRRTALKSQDWRKFRPILFVDEFSYIYHYITKKLIPESFMKNWKALLQENYFNAVLAGQDVMPKFKQRFPNEFGTTQDERVSYLRREDAAKLIDEPIRIGGRHGKSRYREQAIDRIISLTGRSPFYIQILCHRLVEYMNRKRASLVTEADVEQVKEELIQGVNALEPDKFDNLINSGDTSDDAISDQDALKVLIAIAVNSQIGACSRHNIICETDTPIDVIIDDLVKRDVVERERGQYYSIRLGLFKEWLIAHQ